MAEGIEDFIPISEDERKLLADITHAIEPFLSDISSIWYEQSTRIPSTHRLSKKKQRKFFVTWLTGLECIKKDDLHGFFETVAEFGEEFLRNRVKFQTLLMSVHFFRESMVKVMRSLYKDEEELQRVSAVLDKLYHIALVILASSYFNVKDKKLKEYSAMLEEKVEERTLELRNKIKMLTGFHEISDMLRDEVNQETIYGEVTEKIAGLMDVEKCCIILYQRADMLFSSPSSGFGMTEEELQDLKFSLEDAAATFDEWVETEPLISNNPATDERLVKVLVGKDGDGSLLLAKLLVAGEFLGVLRLAGKKGGSFNEEDARLAEIIASRIGAALHTMRLITELRQSEEYLRNIKNFNQEIVEKSPMGIFRLNKDMQLIYENPAAKRIMKVPANEESKAIGMDIRKVPSVIEADVLGDFERLSGGEEIIIETPFRSIYGRNAFLRMRGVPLMREGEFDGAILIVEDITERRKIEETMEKIARWVSATTGEEFFRSLVNHLATALDVDYAFVGELTGEKGDIVKTIAVSDHGEVGDNFIYSLKGTPCSEVVAGKFCYHPSDVQRRFIKDSMLAKMGVESYMGMPLIDSEGRALGLLVAMDSKELRNPKLAKAMFQIFAVRAVAELERKQAEERIIELSHFPEKNPNPVFKIMKDGEIVYCNPAAFKNVDDPERISELLPENYAELVERVVTTRKDARIEHKTKGRIIEYIIWPVSEKAVQVYGRDVTQRKQAEKKLRRAYEELKTVDELKSNIVANVSHELRTPITISLGALELLKYEDDNEKRRKLIAMAEEALVRQNMIVGDLIDAAMMEKQEFKLKLETINVDHVISLVMSDFRAVAQQKRIALTSTIDDDLPLVLADFRKIWHALHNILNNAMKFTESHGSVRVTAKKKDDFVEICVVDTGIGIPEDIQNKVFERFYQLDSSGTRRFGGTGLGLAIVKEIIEAHGGEVDVESTMGKGSKFCFTIPAA